MTSIMQKSASSGTRISQIASKVSSSEPPASETVAISARMRKRRFALRSRTLSTASATNPASAPITPMDISIQPIPLRHPPR